MGALAQSSNGNLDAHDRMFVKKAAQGNLAEVQLGQLALQKSSSPEVKQFAQRMIDDHTKAEDQLKQVASQENVTLPDSPNAEQKATKDRLEKLSGKSFDRAYMKDMVTDHTKDVSEFKMEARDAKDPAVKNYASQTAPVIESHLKEAKSIAPQTATAKEGHKTATSASTSY
jgi:putative membrane protein